MGKLSSGLTRKGRAAVGKPEELEVCTQRVDGNGARKMLAQDEHRSAVQFYRRVTLRRDLKTSRAAAVRPRMYREQLRWSQKKSVPR